MFIAKNPARQGCNQKKKQISPRSDSCAHAHLQNIKMEILVMPAWIASIQARRIRPETSMSAWISALHAGKTQWKASA
jgi:hypothetical protein